jgi:PAS domain S-box-containing protein
MYKVFVTILFLISTTFVSGQRYNFKNYFVDDGLSQSQITDIESDNEGNLWLATFGGGVDCFDGINFHNYGLKEGLPHHQVKDICIDSSRVWVGLQKGGGCVIENGEVIQLSNILLEKSTINAICVGKEFVFLGTDEGNLFRVDENKSVELFFSFNEVEIVDIVTYGNLILIATKEKGVWKVDGDSVAKLFEIDEVTALSVVDDRIWIGAGFSLYTSDDGKKLEKHRIQLNHKVIGITADVEHSCVWVGLYGGGVIRMCDDKIEMLKEDNGLPSNYVLSLHTDKYGLIWIGTDGAGLSKFMGFQFIHYSFNDGSSGEAVMSILKSKNDYWFATYGNGVYNVGERIKGYGTNNYLPTDSYYSMIEDANGSFWFATKTDGLVVFNPKSKNARQYNHKNSIIGNELLHITEDDDGIVYISSRNKGLYIYFKGAFIQFSKQNGLPENQINFTFIDSENNIWLATATSGILKITRNDLFKYIRNEEKVLKYEIFAFKNLRIQPQVLTIAEDTSNRIWFGLFGEGLGFVEKQQINLVSENEQLISRNIYGLVYDNIHHKLWMGTDKGLVSVQLFGDGSIKDIQSYSSYDGFSGVECNRNAIYYDAEENDVWVGTVKGVTKFNPDLYAPSKIPPKLKIKSVEYYGIPVSYITYKNDEKINWKHSPFIPHDSSHILIDFLGIDQWRPNKVMYTWKINGLNDTWHELTHNNAVEFSYLPPGRYVFQLRAKAANGRWSKYTLNLPFTVSTPFYQTTKFYLLMGFLFIGILLAYIYFRNLSLKNRNKKLREAVLERTEALNNEKVIVEQQKEELRAQTDHLERANKELEKLSLVASKTDNAVLIADKDGNWEWANSGFEKMYGYTLAEFIEERGGTILESSTSSKITHILDEATQLKKSVTYTAKGLRKDKTEMWIQSTLTPIFDISQKLKRFIVIDTNITHIKKINNELRKLSLVASKTDNSVIMMDRTGKINWVNDAFHRFYDLSLEEFKVLYQRNIFDLHEGIKGIFEPEEILKSRKSKSYISSFVTGKGVHKWIQTVVTPVSGIGSSEGQLIAIEADITRIKEVEEEVKAQRQKSDELLLNILPEETAEELKSQGQAQPRYYNSATVMFTDFKNFTKYCEELSPKQLVDELREYFNGFDDVVTKYFVEKIKTIGDSYMCVGGLPLRNRSHPFDVVLSALEIQKLTREINNKKKEGGGQPWEMRIGIHTGDLVAGVVGKKKFAYDIWGNTVNVASRMEGACEVGKVNISGETYDKIKDYFECTFRGKVDAKSNGKFDMYFVERIRPEYSLDQEGLIPNDSFKEYLARL